MNKRIDDLAYDFWAVHPKDIDEWEKTAPKMPEKYPGGHRAWYFACKMRELLKASDKRSHLANQRADELEAKMKVLLELKDDGTAPVEPGDLTELLFFAYSWGCCGDHPHKMTPEQMLRWRQFVPVPRSTHQRVSAALERSALWRFWNRKALELAEKIGALREKKVESGQLSINFNEAVRVRLTETGEKIMADRHEELRQRLPSVGPYTPRQKDADGFVAFAIWDLMQTFGSQMFLGNPNLPFESEIRLPASKLSPSKSSITA